MASDQPSDHALEVLDLATRWNLDRLDQEEEMLGVPLGRRLLADASRRVTPVPGASFSWTIRCVHRTGVGVEPTGQSEAEVDEGRISDAGLACPATEVGTELSLLEYLGLVSGRIRVRDLILGGRIQGGFAGMSLFAWIFEDEGWQVDGAARSAVERCGSVLYETELRATSGDDLGV